MKRLFGVLSIVAAIAIGAGIAFKLMHWPYSEIILLNAIGGLSLFYTLRFWRKKEKRFVDYVKLTLIVSFALRLVFPLYHLPYQIVIDFLFYASFILWSLLEGVSYFFATSKKEFMDIEKAPKRWYQLLSPTNGLMTGAFFGLVIGAFGKLCHLPFGNDFLISGLMFWAMWYVLILLESKKRLIGLLMIAAIALLVTGIIFRYSHKAGADLMLLGAFAIGGVSFAVDYFSSKKTADDIED